MGVICLAASIEKWNLHKRIALRMVMIAGAKPGMWAAHTHKQNTLLSLFINTLKWDQSKKSLVQSSEGYTYTSVNVTVSCSRLVLGFMCCTVFLSMWLSNTSTTAMVMPIAEAVLQQLICTGLADSHDSETAEATEDEAGMSGSVSPVVSSQEDIMYILLTKIQYLLC